METTFFVKVNGIEYPTLSIDGRVKDSDWNDRESKCITMQKDLSSVCDIFTDGMSWSIVQHGTRYIAATDSEGNLVYDDNGNVIIASSTEYIEEYDNSEYHVLGDITKHYDGSVSIKLGKETNEERLLTMLYGGAN